MHFFHARVGLVRFAQNAHWNTLCRKCVFTSSGIRGSRSAFRCVRGAKRYHTIFHARVGKVGISQKAQWDTLRQTSIFASCGISGLRSAFRCIRGAKIDALFSCSMDGFDKKSIWTHYTKHISLHLVGSTGHVVHSGTSRA
jgi:hypothetical protein